jgi:hypothetical protein
MEDYLNARPMFLALHPSFGFDDRLGLATAFHLAADV